MGGEIAFKKQRKEIYLGPYVHPSILRKARCLVAKRRGRITEPYTSSDLLLLAMNGGEFDPLRIAATYADKRNWGRMNDPSYGCRWYWKGPVICAYELASWVKKEPDTRQLERDVIEAARGVIFGWYKSEFDPSKKCPDVNLEDAVIALDRAKGKEGKE